MTDKQRADHVQAKYWNGYVTRTEVQKVFDELGQVVQQLRTGVMTMDLVVQMVTEKLGLSHADIEVWCKAEMEKRKAAAIAAQENASAVSDTDLPQVQGQSEVTERARAGTPSVVLTDMA